MTLKQATFNAGPKICRLLLVFVLSGFFSFALGWALYSFQLGVIFVLWTHALGLLVLPLVWWLYLRLGPQKLQRVDLEKQPELLTEYLKNILAKPGPRIRLWIRRDHEINFLWYESYRFHRRSTQDLIVTSQWLSSTSSEERVADWNKIWQTVAEQTSFQRKLRSFDMILWLSWFSLLAPVLTFFDFVLDAIFDTRGIKLSFFLQYWAWRLKNFCFDHVAEAKEGFEGPSLQQNYPHPKIWNSLSWGVWFQIPERSVHPLWKELTHRKAFLKNF